MTGGIAIDLSEEEATLFLEFRRVQDTLSVLNKAGVFHITNGKAILNFNEQGILTEIKVDRILYKRLSPPA